MPRLLSALLGALAVLVTGAGLAWACTPDGTSDEPGFVGSDGPPASSQSPAAPPAAATPPGAQPGANGTAAPSPTQAGDTAGGEARVVGEGPARALSPAASSERRSRPATGGPAPGPVDGIDRTGAAAPERDAPAARSEGEAKKRRAATVPSERSVAANLAGGLLPSSPTVANATAPAAGPGGQLSLGLALLGIGALGLTTALMAGMARRRRPADARSRQS